MHCKFKFKSGDLVEIINPDRHAFYLEHGRIKYAYQNISSHENMYNVSFGDDISYDFEENDLRLFAEVRGN